MMMNMIMKDDWVAAALSDDTLVADLLSRLNQSSSQSSKPPPSSLSLPLGWGHRQPRSKLKKDSATTTTTRCSPTTPLSWSGGGGAASPSDGDYSNSSGLSSDLSRSKCVYTTTTTTTPPPPNNDATNIYANKRFKKKKKSFAQLQEQQSLLLEERVSLKRREQRVRSENLNRIKIDLSLHTTNEVCVPSAHTQVVFSNLTNQMEASTSHHTHSTLPRHAAVHEGIGSSSVCRVEKKIDMQKKDDFALPDLNTMPSPSESEEEEDGGAEMVNGMS